MKTIYQLVLTSALLAFSPLASASTYTGTWKNTTFGSSGALTIDLNFTKTKVSGVIDLDGGVFGGGDPPAIPFSAKLASNGSGNFSVKGTAIGDIAGSFTAKGKLTMTITNVPGGSIEEARVNGNFDLKTEKFTGSYGVDFFLLDPAEGVLEAHVIKAPTVNVAKKVTVSGNAGSTQATVVTNVKILSATATANKGAKVKVTGKNPFQVRASKLKPGVTRVVLTVTNADNLKTKKVIKFVRK